MSRSQVLRAQAFPSRASPSQVSHAQVVHTQVVHLQAFHRPNCPRSHHQRNHQPVPRNPWHIHSCNTVPLQDNYSRSRVSINSLDIFLCYNLQYGILPENNVPYVFKDATARLVIQFGCHEPIMV